jgi:hypothetical protein
MRTRGKPFQLSHFIRLPFAVEVALAVLIKLLVLAWLWNTFFSAPPTKKMRLPTAQVEQHLLSSPQAGDTARPHSSSAEAMHDPH